MSSAQTTELSMSMCVYVQDANLVLVVRGTLHVLQQSVGMDDKEVSASHCRLSSPPLFLCTKKASEKGIKKFFNIH